MTPEPLGIKIRGVTLALILGTFGLIGYWLIWKPCAWVVQAFKDLLEDETHLDKPKGG